MTVPAMGDPSVEVSERCRAELTLRAALDVSPDGFAVHRVRRDPDGRVVGFTLEAINTAGAAPHAAGPADIVGRDLTELLSDPEATGIPAAFRAAADTGLVQQLRTAFVSDDWSGTMDLQVARVDADRIVATWRDVTDLVRSEQILIEAYTRAQAAWDCLYGVLDAVEDAVFLLNVRRTDSQDGESGEMGPVGQVGPDGGERLPAVPAQSTPMRRPAPAILVVEYLNAAAAGTRDRAVLIGQGFADVRPDLVLESVIDLVAAAATDRPGCVRRLIMTGPDQAEIAAFTASPAPPAIAAPIPDTTPETDSADSKGRNVVLVVRQPPEPP